MTLRVRLPEVGATFHVARGVVRWVQGSRFGVEFIAKDQKDRLRYNATVGEFLQRQAASPARPDQKRYSGQPGGVNWHLEEREVSTAYPTLSRMMPGRRIR